MKLLAALIVLFVIVTIEVLSVAAQGEEEETCISSNTKGLSKRDPNEPRRKYYKKDDKKLREKINKMLSEGKIPKPGKGNKPNKNRKQRAVELCDEEYFGQLNVLTTFMQVTTECSTLETCDTYCTAHPDCFGFFSLDAGGGSFFFYLYTSEINPIGWSAFAQINSYVCPISTNCAAFPDSIFAPSGGYGGQCSDPASCEAACFYRNAYETDWKCFGFYYSGWNQVYYLYGYGPTYNRWSDVVDNLFTRQGDHSYACGCAGDFRTIDNKVPISTSSCGSFLLGDLQKAYTDCSSDVNCNSVIEYRSSGYYRKCFYTPGIPALTLETNCFFHICNCMDWNTNP